MTDKTAPVEIVQKLMKHRPVDRIMTDPVFLKWAGYVCGAATAAVGFTTAQKLTHTIGHTVALIAVGLCGWIGIKSSQVMLKKP